MYVPILTPEQFAVALVQPLPVLALFGQRGCEACRATKPVVRGYANRHPELEAVELNVDTFEDLADAYHIHNTPTLILFVAGRPVTRGEGEFDEKRVERLVARGLGR